MKQLIVEVTLTEDSTLGKKGQKKKMEISTARAIKKVELGSFTEPKETIPMDVSIEGKAGTITSDSGAKK